MSYTGCTCVFHKILTINIDYFSCTALTCLCNADCVLWEVRAENLCINFVSFILQISLKVKFMILCDVTPSSLN